MKSWWSLKWLAFCWAFWMVAFVSTPFRESLHHIAICRIFLIRKTYFPRRAGSPDRRMETDTMPPNASPTTASTFNPYLRRILAHKKAVHYGCTRWSGSQRTWSMRDPPPSPQDFKWYSAASPAPGGDSIWKTREEAERARKPVNDTSFLELPLQRVQLKSTSSTLSTLPQCPHNGLYKCVKFGSLIRGGVDTFTAPVL